MFVRLEDNGGPSVAEMMTPYEAEIAPYRFEEMRTLSPVRLRERAVNWKNVGDNYSDNLHIPVAHAGLTRLFGKSYAIEAQPWVDKMSGYLADKPSNDRWERLYQAHLPRAGHLPEAQQKLWLYYKLWPNMAFDIYPDQVDFMQWLPLSPTTCVLREMAFALPGRPARDEAGALRQLADQPDGQCRGHLADHPCAAGHGVAKLYGRADRGERGVPAQLCEEDPGADPRGTAAQGAGAGMEPAASPSGLDDPTTVRVERSRDTAIGRARRGILDFARHERVVLE